MIREGTRQWCRNNGICPVCRTNKIAENRKYCRECLIILNEIEKNNYRWYKEHNICPICRVNKPEEGYVSCSACREKAKQKRAKQKRDRKTRKKGV